MTTEICNGRIQPNGFCDKCYQNASGTSSYCGRLIPIQPMKQQTPLQKLIEKMKHNLEYFTPPNNEFQAGRRAEASSLIKYAESLLPEEKQMVIDAVDTIRIIPADLTGEQYFNETYK